MTTKYVVKGESNYEAGRYGQTTLRNRLRAGNGTIVTFFTTHVTVSRESYRS